MVGSHPGLQGLFIQEHPEVEAALAEVMRQVDGKRLVLSCGQRNQQSVQGPPESLRLRQSQACWHVEVVNQLCCCDRACMREEDIWTIIFCHARTYRRLLAYYSGL